ncbi:hypothetical protein ACNJU8_21365, partial [Mycobacterium tuberculosis]
PLAGEACWGLANLKIGVLTDADEAEMQRLLAGSLTDDDRMRIEYALARRLEDTGRPDEAFPHYARGAALARVRFANDSRDYPAELATVREVFTPEF